MFILCKIQIFHFLPFFKNFVARAQALPATVFYFSIYDNLRTYLATKLCCRRTLHPEKYTPPDWTASMVGGIQFREHKENMLFSLFRKYTLFLYACLTHLQPCCYSISSRRCWPYSVCSGRESDRGSTHQVTKRKDELQR